MLIQNVGNAAQPVQLPRLTGNGAPHVVVDAPRNTEVKPVVLPEPPKPQNVPNMVEALNKVLKQSNKNLEFSVDADTSKAVVRLVDTETGDTIRQFPSEEMLAISRAIEQVQQGLLLKQKA